MASFKVLRTTGSEDEIISKSEVKPNQLFITELSNKIVTGSHDIGDVLVDENGKNRFAMVVKNTLTDKINAAALRTSIFKLLFEMNQMGSCENGLLISRHQFCNKKEESTFICSLDEIIMLLSMMNVIPEGFEIKLIIADSKEED